MAMNGKNVQPHNMSLVLSRRREEKLTLRKRCFTADRLAQDSSKVRAKIDLLELVGVEGLRGVKVAPLRLHSKSSDVIVSSEERLPLVRSSSLWRSGPYF